MRASPRRRGPGSFTTALFGLLIFAAMACGSEPRAQDPNGNGPDPDPPERALRLAVVGLPLAQIEVGSTATLRVALVEEEVGPVANEAVTFAAIGMTAGSTLAGGLSSTFLTDAQGMASVELAAGASETTFQVTASAEGANTVAFSVQVIKLQHRIGIVRTPNVRVDTSGTSASVESSTHSRVLLRARITDQFGRPVPDLQLWYSIEPRAESAKFEGGASTALTNPAGEAQLALETGTDPDDAFSVLTRTSEGATARWNVRLLATDTICIADEDCPPGLYCRSGVCQGSAACSNDEPKVECPLGYRCVINECHPYFDIGCDEDDDCGEGFECYQGACRPITPECSNNEDCPSGFECIDGVCISDQGPVPIISGGWYTAHHFDIQQGLPSIVGTAAGPLREIHKILLGEMDLPWWASWLEPIIEGIIDQYVPPWVTTVVQILDTLVTVMSDLRAKGYMSVSQTGPLWSATELWDSFVFYYLPMCGGSIPSDRTPECARVDLFVDELTDHVSLGLRVHPFTGTVSEISGNTAALLVNDREVDMNVARLIRWVVDTLVWLLTPYDDLESAVLASVDCHALGQSAESLLSGIGGIVEGACNTGVRLVLDRVLDTLTGTAFEVGMLKFSGNATVNDINLSTNYASLLGYPNHETSRDGRWDGRFTRVVGGIPGAWHASRRSLP